MQNSHSDYSCVEDNTGRKRSVDESSQSSQSPPLVVKRPRVQYPVAMMTGNDLTKQVYSGKKTRKNQVYLQNLEHKVLSALLQAQMQQQLAAACANQTTQNLAPQVEHKKFNFDRRGIMKHKIVWRLDIQDAILKN